MQTWMPAIHAGMTSERKVMKHFVVSYVYARSFAQAAENFKYSSAEIPKVSY
jgi:hypothetical protein